MSDNRKTEKGETMEVKPPRLKLPQGNEWRRHPEGYWVARPQSCPHGTIDNCPCPRPTNEEIIRCNNFRTKGEASR